MTPPPLDYPLHTYRLGNGLRVVLSPDPWTPVVAVNLWYDVGSGRETAGRTGFAHLFEHLMFQGSAHVASGEHLGLLQAAGGSVNGTTSFDRTNYFEAVPVGALDLALWLEADRMGSLLQAVDQANLDTQREVVKEEKRQRYDNVPYGDVMRRLLELTFPADHPYGHTTIGSMDDLDAATLADVHAFFTTWYRPSNAVITLAGAIDVDDALARVERYFEPIASGPEPSKSTPPPLPALTTVPRDEVRSAVPRDSVYLAWRLPAQSDPDFDRLLLGASVLGDGLTSRLHRRLVRGDETAEGTGASALGLQLGTSLAVVSARVREGEDPLRVEAALAEEIEALATTGPTEAEVARARVQFSREWLTGLAALDSRADQLSAATVQFGDPERVNRRLAAMSAITADEVHASCAAHLRDHQRATLVYLREDRP